MHKSSKILSKKNDARKVTIKEPFNKVWKTRCQKEGKKYLESITELGKICENRSKKLTKKVCDMVARKQAIMYAKTRKEKFKKNVLKSNKAKRKRVVKIV